MFHKTTFIYLTVTLLGTAYAWTDYLSFDSSCYNYQIYNVNPDKTYIISWSGNSIQQNCKIGFHGYDSNHVLNDYKVCVRATKWQIQNPQVKLRYYTGFSDFLQKTFTSGSSWDLPTTEWCANSNEYVDIKLVTAFNSYNQGSITLEVTGVKTYNYDAHTGYTGYIAGGVAGAVFLCAIINFVIVVSCRRRRSPGVKYGVANTSGTIITQSSSQQTSGGIANPGYMTGPAPPPYDAVSNNSSGMTAQGYPQQSYQQYTTPLPSQQTTPTQQTSKEQLTKTS